MAFGSKQFAGKLAKEDLQRPDGTYATATVTIDKLRSHTFDGDDRETWFMSFTGKDKELTLNQTNMEALERNFGTPPDADSDEVVTAQYAGESVLLYVDPTVKFGGKLTGGLRIIGTGELPVYKDPNLVDEHGQLKNREQAAAGSLLSDDEPPTPESNEFEGADDLDIPF